MDRIKVTVSREDGNSICPTEPKPGPIFLTDANPVLIVKKDNGTVETFSGDLYALLEFTARQLKGLGVKERRELCDTYAMSAT